MACLSFLLERYAFFNLNSMTPLLGASLSVGERGEALSELRVLLVRAGQFGSALEAKAQSLLAHALLTEALTHAYQKLFLLIAAIYLILAFLVLFVRVEKRTQ